MVDGGAPMALGALSGVIGEQAQSADMYARTLSPLATDLGSPLYWAEMGSSFFVWPIPSYTLAGGFKIFYERNFTYFSTIDTTKEPGIPTPFHNLMAMIASELFLSIHKPSATTLISRLASDIQERIIQFDAVNAMRFPSKPKITIKQIDTK
jgi:hypothetical protein